MKKNKNMYVWGAVSVLISSLLMGNASASPMKNNLSIKAKVMTITSQEVFLVSKPTSLIKVKKDLSVLARYQDSTHLSDRDLKALLRAVGFKGKGLKSAWAIAKRESNGQPIRFNGNTRTGDSSFGLFQINMIGQLNPERKAKFGINYTSDLLNPVINAQIAYYMSRGGYDWSSWHGINAKAKEWLLKYPI
jgi:hypothetical protein